MPEGSAHGFLSFAVLAALDADQKESSASLMYVLAVFLVVAGCSVLGLLCRSRMSNRARELLRLAGFLSLHIADYVTNLLTMWIVFNHQHYFVVLLLSHCIIGVFCVYTAAISLRWQEWPCAPIVNFVFMAIVMGLMQGVQVKLAFEDYQHRRELAGGSEDESERVMVPAMMPARFHCKAMDGLLEGTVFSFVAMYALLKRGWVTNNGVTIQEWEAYTLYLGAFFSVLSAGLALMEVDHRTSASVQRLLSGSSFAQVKHLLFRASEFSLRLLTVLAFCTFMRPLQGIWWLAYVLIALDYLLGVALLVFLGGRDPVREATAILGVPLFMVNIMQFVDAPGMSLQARRISNTVLPIRTAETIMVIIFGLLVPIPDPFVDAKDNPNQVTVRMWEFLGKHREMWVIFWMVSFVLYYVLLATYACRTKPGADLHSAVAYGDVKCLEELLRSSELVLDISRYGPDGRNPLHLAALRGQVECMKLLIEERANLEARTQNVVRNTALHMAAMNKAPQATAYLCQACSGNAALLNAVNADGDTPLHIAARRQFVDVLNVLLRNREVDFRITNKRGLKPVDCAPSDKFGFDRNSAESAITELFQHAEAGTLHDSTPSSSSTGPPGSFELSNLSFSSPSKSAKSRMGNGFMSAGSGSSASSGSVVSSQPSLRSQDGGEHVRVDDPTQHGVPLVSVKKTEEDAFLRRTNTTTHLATGHTAMAVTNLGISSFMLSAGLGAVSRAFLGSIREEAEEGEVAEQPNVTASFDDFSEIKALGEGAFGKVLLVRQKATGELFAMKLMDKAKFRAQKITSKAVSEQFILKTTRHPFIVSLHYAFQGSTFWALVMDYCPNGDLQCILIKCGSPGLPLPDAARFSGEVLLALEHLHNIHVIFRDLKLENVVVDADFRAKVTDFGLAKKLLSASEARTMCGSYGYAAPEIMLNTGKYGYSVDLYSYGVMFYMLLSGGELSQKRAGNGPPQPAMRLPPMKHASLRRKILQCDKDPSLVWARPEVNAIQLLKSLTSEVPAERTTASQVKMQPFFEQHLGFPVEDLLSDQRIFQLPVKPGDSD